MKKGRKATPKTELDALPQFQPGRGFDIDYVNTETGTLSGFTSQRRTEIRNILTGQIEPYVRTVNWLEMPTGLERFLREAEHAIAIYLDQRNLQLAFDRE